MKISGFTFVRNGTLLGYPYIESIKSLLLLCDEVIVAIGNSDDDTYDNICRLQDSRIKIITTNWNESMRSRGYVYAQQKMIAQFNCTGDWAVYLECDEIFHENDILHIRSALEHYLSHPDVEAIAFKYHHFYGSSEFIALSPRWYTTAPRVIRNNIRTWAPDGLFWVVMDGNKHGRYPNAVELDTYIYHYGHVRPVACMNLKQQHVEKYWNKIPQLFTSYSSKIDPKTLHRFTGSHPAVMSEWLLTKAEKSFQIGHDYSLNWRDIRHRVLLFICKFIDKSYSKKRYKVIKR